LSAATGSCGSVLRPLLPAFPASPQRLYTAIQALLLPSQSSGILKNASIVYPRGNVSAFSGAASLVGRYAPCSGFFPPTKRRLAWPGWSGRWSSDHVSASPAEPGTLSMVRSLPRPDRSRIVWPAVTGLPSAPPASKRQYASVPGTTNLLPGRGGRAV